MSTWSIFWAMVILYIAKQPAKPLSEANPEADVTPYSVLADEADN